MSAKNTKVPVPVYDMKSQLDYLSFICKEFDFSCDTLISLILADWIYTFQLGLSRDMSGSDIFVRYIKKSVRTRENFRKLAEVIDGQKK